MAFVESLDDGWVNLDHVARIDERAGKYVLLSAKGNQMGVISSAEMGALRPVLPATAGLIAIVMHCFGEGGGKPQDSDIFVEHQLILGWRESGDYREAIFIQKLANNELAFLQVGTQLQALEYDSRSAPDLEAARAIVLEDATAEWERRNRIGEAG